MIDKTGAAALAQTYQQGGPNAVTPLIGQAVQSSKSAQALAQKDRELETTQQRKEAEGPGRSDNRETVSFS